jgi:hypothetical protein
MTTRLICTPERAGLGTESKHNESWRPGPTNFEERVTLTMWEPGLR